MSPRLRLRVLWCLRVRPLLRRALGVPALDHSTTFDARLSALEAAFTLRGQRVADIEARVARLARRDVIDAADLADATRELVNDLAARYPNAGGGETWSPTYGDLIALLDRAAEKRRERESSTDRGTL